MYTFVLLVLLLVIGALTAKDLSPIDKIIGKHYTRHFEERSFSLDLDSHNELSIDGLECGHEHFVAPFYEEAFQVFRARHLTSRSTRSNAVQEESLSSKRLVQDDLTHIRFYINTTLLEGQNDIGRSCYNTGDVVQIGIAQSPTTTCTTQIINNCWYTCQAVDVLTPAMQNYLINAVVPALTDVYKNLLEVKFRPNDDRLVLDDGLWNDFGRQCFYSIPVPELWVTEGIPNVDYAVFMTGRPAGSAGTVAYAGACNYLIEDGEVFRPSAGFVNFIPRHFETDLTPFEFRGAVRVGIHEFAHALGFSGSNFDLFRDRNGQLWEHPTAIETKMGNDVAYNISKVTTPRVANFARRHFDCTNMNGFELESSGGAGTAGSHWDKRIGGDEFMTGFVNPLMPITALSLSLFEDSGWYTIDYSTSEPFEWGKGLGCGFSEGRCETEWPSPYFCAQNAVQSCTPQREAKGACQVINYGAAVPRQYQRFQDPNFGGIASMDFCPTVFGSKTGFCVDTSQTANTSRGETYGPNSKCMDAIVDGQLLPTCYEITCNMEQEILSVVISGTSYMCPKEGGNLAAGSVSLVCPSFLEMCGQSLFLQNWPSFAGITPLSGVRTNGLSIVIDGENFDSNAQYQITLGDVLLTDVVVRSSNQITGKTGDSCNFEGPLADLAIIDTVSGRSAYGFAVFEFTGPIGEECQQEIEESKDKDNKLTSIQIVLIVMASVFGLAVFIVCTILIVRFIQKRQKGDYQALL